MLWVPQKGKLLHENNVGAVGTANLGASVTTGAGTSATKGTPAELIAATAFDAYLVKIVATRYSVEGGVSQGCLDILTGAATEEVLIPNLLMGNCPTPATGQPPIGTKEWLFPLYIPAGSRIAARAAGARLSTAFRVAIYLWGGDALPPFRVGSKVLTYGVTTVPAGVGIVPGASAAQGSWTQITAATSEDHFALVPSFQAATEPLQDVAIVVGMGIGAAAEEELAQSAMFGTSQNEQLSGPVPCFPAFQDVPLGTRLVMRASNSGTNATYDGAIHAVS